LGHASEFNQKNLSEYKSHLIIKYFQFSSTNIRYLNERDNLHIHYIINNKRIFMWFISYAARANEITLRHYCSIKLHVRFISRNVDMLASTIKINKRKTHINYKHVLAVHDTLDCMLSASQLSSTQAQCVVYKVSSYFSMCQSLLQFFSSCAHSTQIAAS